MVTQGQIAEVIASYLESNSLFLVGVKISPSYDIEVTIDSENRVELSNCIEINNIIIENFNRETNDYSLTITSAGLNQPLKVLRQYKKYIDKEIEILMKDGKKFKATLLNATEDELEITTKNSQEREVLKLTETKQIKPVINFK